LTVADIGAHVIPVTCRRYLMSNGTQLKLLSLTMSIHGRRRARNAYLLGCRPSLSY